MTVQQLANIIFMLCMHDTDRLKCFDYYVNCSVKSDGIIMNELEFKYKCVKLKKEEK